MVDKKKMSFPSDFDGAHHVAIKQADDDMNYQQAYSQDEVAYLHWKMCYL